MKAPQAIHDPVETLEGVSSNPLQAVEPSSNRRRRINVIRTLEQVRKTRPIWEMLLARAPQGTGVEVDFNRYLSVIESAPEYTPYILVLFEENTPCAMLIGMRGPVQINCQLGYLRLFKPSLVGIKVLYGGYLGDPGGQSLSVLIDHLYASICENGTDVVRFEQLPLQDQMFSLARKRPSVFCRSYFPKIDMHWRLNIPGSMDAFYAQRSSKTRQTLKRYSRQIEKIFQTQLIDCTNEHCLSNILSEAASVSSQTYQHALGWGLTDDAETRQQLIATACNGWLRLHLLRLNGKACAFQLGYQYRGVYFLQTMGFDPEMKQWRLGTALFLRVLEQLCDDSSIDYLDFGYGDAEYKRRFGTEHWDEATVYMFAPRIYPVLVNLIHNTVKGLSVGMQWVVRKAGIESKIKQTWRQWLQKRQ